MLTAMQLEKPSSKVLVALLVIIFSKSLSIAETLNLLLQLALLM